MFNLPDSTIVNQVIPKKVFVDKLGANIKMKKHFTNDIIKVEWLAKLAASTLNVADGKEVHEISVFQVFVKENDCPNDVFAFIDSMMPRHTIFILCRGEDACLHLNYKERIKSTANTEKAFRITKTYRSLWINRSNLILEIEGLNMDLLYETLVRQVAADKIISQSNNLKSDIDQSIKREDLLRQIEKLEEQARRETNPKKKFDLVQRAKQLGIRNEKI